MRRYFGVAGLVLIGVVGWRIGDSLSSDAISMAMGVLFGVLAGVPTALLILAAERRRDEQRESRPAAALGAAYPHYNQQPPVIVVTGGAPQASTPMLPAQPYGSATISRWEPQRPQRRYKIVGGDEG
jgi:hypothetical protein